MSTSPEEGRAVHRKALGRRGLELISNTAERLKGGAGEADTADTAAAPVFSLPPLPLPSSSSRRRKKPPLSPLYLTPPALRKKARRIAEKLSIRSQEGVEAARRYEDEVKTKPSFHRRCVDFLEVGLSMWHMREGRAAKEERRKR